MFLPRPLLSANRLRLTPRPMGSMAGWSMLGIAGLLGVVAGGALAYFAEHLSAQTELIETAGGVLILGGFALAGYAMPAII